MIFLCNNIDMKKINVKKLNMKKLRLKKVKVYINAPITLMFVITCFMTIILSSITNGKSTELLFSTYGSSLFNPLTYVRLITHVLGHASLGHLISNSLYLLLLGPILEEKYGNKILIVIVVTAIVTGLFHNIISPDTALLGSSGVVFSFILLASITGEDDGIPLTLILVALLWLGQEIYSCINQVDNISQITHIIGGLSGALLGLVFKDKL